MNVIFKIKTKIKQLFCLHEFSQYGDIACIEEKHTLKYYCKLKCKKCGTIKLEFIEIPHRL